MPEPGPESEAERLLRDLVRKASVTPDAGEALDLAESWLKARGFECHRLVFEADGTPPVDNLFARRGTAAPHLCFAGHLDVVPPGDTEAWSVPPFAAEIRDGSIIGRGVEDMKGGVAAFLAATFDWLGGKSDAPGSISLLLTGDEEGPAINGTVKVLDWMAQNGHTPDHCIVGEPTGVDSLGDVAKIGRRGSLNGRLAVSGRQGHVAYPHRAANPSPWSLGLAAALLEKLDEGSDHFERTNLEITSIDTGNPAVNVIPGQVRIMFNCRFNDHWTSESLETELRRRLNSVNLPDSVSWNLDATSNAESFVTEPGDFSALVTAAVEEATGRTPDLTTGGGTSDARFVSRYCPVIEFGLVGRTMHQVDENVPLADLAGLTTAYRLILDRYFAKGDAG